MSQEDLYRTIGGFEARITSLGNDITELKQEIGRLNDNLGAISVQMATVKTAARFHGSFWGALAGFILTLIGGLTIHLITTAGGR